MNIETEWPYSRVESMNHNEHFKHHQWTNKQCVGGANEYLFIHSKGADAGSSFFQQFNANGCGATMMSNPCKAPNAGLYLHTSLSSKSFIIRWIELLRKQLKVSATTATANNSRTNIKCENKIGNWIGTISRGSRRWVYIETTQWMMNITNERPAKNSFFFFNFQFFPSTSWRVKNVQRNVRKFRIINSDDAYDPTGTSTPFVHIHHSSHQHKTRERWMPLHAVAARRSQSVAVCCFYRSLALWCDVSSH